MSVNLDTGTGSQPAPRTHAAVEPPPVSFPVDLGLGSVPAARLDVFNADADSSRLVVGWNEGGGTPAGYQTWLPPVSPYYVWPAVADSVFVTATTALLIV